MYYSSQEDMPTGPEGSFNDWDKNWLMREDGGAVAEENALLRSLIYSPHKAHFIEHLSEMKM